MPTQPIDTPDIMDVLIAASLKSRRAKLLRAARRQRIATRIGFALSGCVALLALTAHLVARDREAAILCASMALVTFGISFAAWKAGRKRTADLLRQMGSVEQIVGNLR
jgi:hypothetical protein